MEGEREVRGRWKGREGVDWYDGGGDSGGYSHQRLTSTAVRRFGATWSFSNVGGRSRTWAVVLVRGRSSSYPGARFRTWAVGFVRGRPFSCVGDRFRA